jgi:spore coat polysaccharide biosynthesis protein SpsF (cytidylyltransferase family)
VVGRISEGEQDRTDRISDKKENQNVERGYRGGELNFCNPLRKTMRNTVENILIIIQARMSSSRLPGKVLMPVEGKVMLAYLLERLNAASLLENAIIATSVEKTDDPICEFSKKSGVRCHRGALKDVSQRFAGLCEEYPCEAFARLCGDSPLFDMEILKRGIEFFKKEKPDLVTNTFPRSFPKGQSIEIFKSDVFIKARENFDDDEKEHIGKYYYNHPDKFKILNFSAGGDYSEKRLCVDTFEDLERFKKELRAMNKAHYLYGWQAILKLDGNFSQGEAKR